MEQPEKKPFPIKEFMKAKKAKIDDFINNGGYEKHLQNAVDMDTGRPFPEEEILQKRKELIEELDKERDSRNYDSVTYF